MTHFIFLFCLCYNKINFAYQASKVLSYKRGADNAHQKSENSGEETLSHGKVDF